MYKCYQTRPTMGNILGDCFEACLASMLDVDRSDVPDLQISAVEGQYLDDHADDRLQEWLGLHKMSYFEFALPGPLSKVVREIGKRQPGMAYIIIGRTASGHHAVIYRDGKLIHDPAGNDRRPELTEPRDGMFRIGLFAILSPDNNY